MQLTIILLSAAGLAVWMRHTAKADRHERLIRRVMGH